MKKTLFCMCVCVIAVAAVAIAAEEAKPETPKAPAAPAMERPVAGEGMRGPMSRENVYKQMVARRLEIHKAEIAKIEAIVKIAEEENAPKTVEALKALIAEKDKEFQSQIQQTEQRRQDRGTRRPVPAASSPATEQQAQPEAPKPAAKPEKKK